MHYPGTTPMTVTAFQPALSGRPVGRPRRDRGDGGSQSERTRGPARHVPCQWDKVELNIQAGGGKRCPFSCS
jgi:hypothetical protein